MKLELFVWRLFGYFLCFCILALTFTLCIELHAAWREEFSKPCHKATNISSLTDAKLQKWYEGANEEYFLNQLPKNVVVRWADLKPWDDVGMMTHHSDGYLILIDRGTNPTDRQAELTGYHELCHVATYGKEFEDHGPKFETCMVRLANQGAFKGLW